MITRHKLTDEHKSKKGITLIETLATMTIGSILLVTVTQTLFTSQVESIRLANYTEMSLDVRTTQRWFNDDVFNTGSVDFVDEDELVLTRSDDSSTVTYAYDQDTATLTRTSGLNVKTVLNNIEDFTLAYYYLGDESDNPRPITGLRTEQIHRIRLQANLSKGLENKNRETFTVMAGGVLRNRPIVQ